MSGLVSEVWYVSVVHGPTINTKSIKVFSIKPIHLGPHQPPAVPTAWESLSGMSLRDIAAQINKFPLLQVRTTADNEGFAVYLHT